MSARKMVPKGFVFSWKGVPRTLTALRPSRLVPSGPAGRKKDKVWVRCSCGGPNRDKDVWVYNLRPKKGAARPHTTSCGCLQQETRAACYKHLERYREEREPQWTVGRLLKPSILKHFEVLDRRRPNTAISQRDSILVRCRLCGWRGSKEAVSLERQPNSCQRCSGKERWTLARVRRAISGKRVLLLQDRITEDSRGGQTSVRLQDVRFFKCVICRAVKPSTVLSAVRLKTRFCRSCKPDSPWTLGDFRAEVEGLGGKVLGFAEKPDSHLIGVRRKIRVQCPFGHKDSKHADHVARQRTLCRECSSGLSERIVRAHFEAVFGTPFPKGRPKWLRNAKTRYALELDGYSENLRLAFEHDGPHHSGRPIRPGQGQKFFDQVAARDSTKEKLCRLNGVSLVRVACLREVVPLESLRSYILNALKKLGIRPPFPNAPESIAPTPDAVRILNEAKARVEARGGTLLTKEYRGSQQKLSVRCAAGHKFAIRLSHLRDNRWCGECYAARLAKEAATRNGFTSYREQVIAWLGESSCNLVQPKTRDIRSDAQVVIKCRCGKRRSLKAASVPKLKHHGLCRKCVQVNRSRNVSPRANG
jgi:hypothetical protein